MAAFHMQRDFAPELVRGLLTSSLDLALIANPAAERKVMTGMECDSFD